MDVSSNVVFKVKYGDVLRRFNVKIIDGELDLGLNGLREKISSLFGFARDVELMFTYIDEDGDVVSLVDADDLRDVVRQGLNPVRISVKLSSEKDSRISNGSSGSSASCLRSSSKKEPLQNLNDSIAKVAKTLPEPLRDALKVLSSGFPSKESGAAPGATEVIDAFAKLGLSFLAQPLESQVAVEHGSSSSGTGANGSGKSELNTMNGKEDKSLRKDDVWKVPPQATKEKEKAKIVSETEGTSSEKAPGSTVTPPALNLDYRKYGCKKEKVKKDKFKNISGSCANKKPHMFVRKLAGSYTILPSPENSVPNKSEINMPTESRPGMESANIRKSDPVKEGYTGGRMGYVAPGGLYGYPGSIWSNPPVFDLNGSPSGAMYECPFSGVPIGTASASSQVPSPVVQPQRNYSQDDGSGLSFHRGVQCDGCGAHPIIGPRYKSKVRMDYDLCSFCFSQIGNETDYIKMDLPAVSRHLTPFKRMSDSLSGKNFKAKSSASKLDSRFIVDVNIMDGTIMEPLTSFTKIWRMKNSGTTVWPEGTFLLWIGGDKLSDQSSVEVVVPPGGLPVDQELYVSVDFTAPQLPGRYVSYWRLVSPSGQKFGQRVWVLIQVDASVKGIKPDVFQALNLNLPPVTTSGSSVAETVSVDVEPIIEGGHTEPDNSEKMVELVEPLVYSQPNNDEEMKLPDTSLVSDDLLSSAYTLKPSVPLPTTASAPELEQKINTGSLDFVSSIDAPVPNPVVHVVEPIPVMDSEAPNHVSSTTDTYFPEPIIEPLSSVAPIPTSQASAPELGVDSEVEARLLRDLEQMGFQQVDLNKEVLRNSEYDLEQAVDKLCGFSEWDPILEELQEMGFHDTETNKVLLEKNGGSIKRVVMDLIAGEDEN